MTQRYCSNKTRQDKALTDALRLHGLGFVMGHYVDGRFKLVTCGSKALTPTQQHDATIELECLAVHFAVNNCC